MGVSMSIKKDSQLDSSEPQAAVKRQRRIYC